MIIETVVTQKWWSSEIVGWEGAGERGRTRGRERDAISWIAVRNPIKTKLNATIKPFRLGSGSQSETAFHCLSAKALKIFLIRHFQDNNPGRERQSIERQTVLDRYGRLGGRTDREEPTVKDRVLVSRVIDPSERVADLRMSCCQCCK